MIARNIRLFLEEQVAKFMMFSSGIRLFYEYIRRQLHPLGEMAIFLVLSAMGFCFVAEHADAEEPVSDNFVLNASLEETVSDKDKTPRFWRAGRYGENDTVFRYPVEGYKGGKAAHIEMVNHHSGDAKWMFNDVAVTPGAKYTFSNRYRSNAATNIYVRYNNGTCLTEEKDCIFVSLRLLPAAADWTSNSVTFIVPNNVQSLTVFQSLGTDGWLSVDAFALVPDEPELHTDDHKIPNSSLTDAVLARNTPVGWTSAGYGENHRQYEYITDDGYDDNTSVKVTVSEYKSGDAKWMYTPQQIIGGSDYFLSLAYKTNVAPQVVLQFTDGAGKITYLGLPRAFSRSANWSRYEQEFSVPEGVIFATAFMFVSENGYLQTDDYSITPYTYRGFERPLVTLTFDDGAKANVNTALPIMDRYGFKSTQCYMTLPLAKDEEDVRNVQKFRNEGHEICSHSVTHPDLTTLSKADLTRELRDSRSLLEEVIGTFVPNFASPYGAYDPAVLAEIEKYYALHRTVNEGYNSPGNLNLYELKVQNMKPDTSLAQFREWVDKSIADKTWLILVYHRVDSGNLGALSAYDTQVDDFAAQMEYLASTGVTVKRLDEAVAEVLVQMTAAE